MDSSSRGNILGSVQPARMSQTEEQLIRMDQAIEAVVNGLNQMESQLIPVLRVTGPSSAEKSGTPVEALCPVADRLRTMGDRLNQISTGITETRQRIEI